MKKLLEDQFFQRSNRNKTETPNNLLKKSAALNESKQNCGFTKSSSILPPLLKRKSIFSKKPNHMAQADSNQTYKHIKYVGKRPKDDQDNHCREKLAHLVKDIGCFYELCPEKLYLICLSKGEDSTVFCNDQILNNPSSSFIFWSFKEGYNWYYDGFNNDFGPYNLATTHLFCSRLKIWFDTQHLRDPDKYVAIVLDDSNPEQKLNAKLATAIAAMVLLNMTDVEVKQRLNFYMTYKGKIGEPRKELHLKDSVTTFADVSGHRSIIQINLKDCIEAFYAAMKLNFYNYYDFDHADYMFYEAVLSGDSNWIIPNKILAFAGPCDGTNRSVINHKHRPQFYYHYFKDHNVTTIVRLNEPEYDSSGFTDYGFEHFDLIFPDGSPPTSTIANKFIKIVDEAKGAVAVHCYAGIGRTGTLIATYLMSRYNFSVPMAIAWIRICRPGSVIGVQQDWLFKMFKVVQVNSNKKNVIKVKKSQSNEFMEDVNIEPNQRQIIPETATPSSTTYEIAEKTFGQARALVLTKNKREKLDRSCTMKQSAKSTKNKCNVGDDGDNSKVSKDNSLNKAAANVRKTDIILDLGKTIPMRQLSSDNSGFKLLPNNSKLYTLVDDEYEWKVKLPESGYVEIVYDDSHKEKSRYTSRESKLAYVFEMAKEGAGNKVTNTKKPWSPPMSKLKPIIYNSIFS